MADETMVKKYYTCKMVTLPSGGRRPEIADELDAKLKKEGEGWVLCSFYTLKEKLKCAIKDEDDLCVVVVHGEEKSHTDIKDGVAKAVKLADSVAQLLPVLELQQPQLLMKFKDQFPEKWKDDAVVGEAIE